MEFQAPWHLGGGDIFGLSFPVSKIRPCGCQLIRPALCASGFVLDCWAFTGPGLGMLCPNSRHCKDGTFVRTCRLVCRWPGAFALWSPLSRLSAGEASEKVMLTILGFEWAIWYCQPFVFNRPGLDLSGFSYVSCPLRGGVRQPWVRMPALLSTGCKPWEDDPRLSDPVISFVQHAHCSFIHLLGGVSHLLHAYLVRACSGCFQKQTP